MTAMREELVRASSEEVTSWLERLAGVGFSTLILGPARSGKSTTLEVMAAAAGRKRGVAAVTPEDATGPLSVVTTRVVSGPEEGREALEELIRENDTHGALAVDGVHSLGVIGVLGRASARSHQVLTTFPAANGDEYDRTLDEAVRGAPEKDPGMLCFDLVVELEEAESGFFIRLVKWLMPGNAEVTLWERVDGSLTAGTSVLLYSPPLESAGEAAEHGLGHGYFFGPPVLMAYANEGAKWVEMEEPPERSVLEAVAALFDPRGSGAFTTLESALAAGSAL